MLVKSLIMFMIADPTPVPGTLPERHRRDKPDSPMILYLTPTLQGCYQMIGRCVLAYFVPCYYLCNPPLTTKSCLKSTLPWIVSTTPVLHTSGCALAHPCAAERRLMVTAVDKSPGIHTSFPCSL